MPQLYELPQVKTLACTPTKDPVDRKTRSTNWTTLLLESRCGMIVSFMARVQICADVKLFRHEDHIRSSYAPSVSWWACILRWTCIRSLTKCHSKVFRERKLSGWIASEPKREALSRKVRAWRTSMKVFIDVDSTSSQTLDSNGIMPCHDAKQSNAVKNRFPRSMLHIRRGKHLYVCLFI